MLFYLFVFDNLVVTTYSRKILNDYFMTIEAMTTTKKPYVKHIITTAIYPPNIDGESTRGPQKEIEAEVIEERETAYCVLLVPDIGRYRGITCTQWVAKTDKTSIYQKVTRKSIDTVYLSKSDHIYFCIDGLVYRSLPAFALRRAYNIRFEWALFGLQPCDQPDHETLYNIIQALDHPNTCVLDVDATIELLRYRVVYKSLVSNIPNYFIKHS